MKTSVYAGLCCLIWAACAETGSQPEPPESALPSPAQAEATAQASALTAAAPSSDDPDLLYIVEPQTGQVAREIPPAVLTDILAQLERRGLKRELEQVKNLYDVGSGRVRDPSRAARAEARIRALGRESGRRP